MKKTVLLAVCLLAVVMLQAKTVVLYHTSDTHGFFYPKNGQGGFAGLASVVNHEKHPHLLLDSGDFANGTVETKISKGAKAVELMNAVGYQAATVGNHEFDFKDAGIDALLPQAKFAVLAANMRDKTTGRLPTWAKAYEVFEVDGVKVGVIGLANRTPTQPTQKYQFTKPLKALKNTLNELQAQHPDVIVVLAHDSFVDYQNGILPYMGEIGKKFSGQVHVVLGGHAHKIVQNERVGQVLYAEPGNHLQGVTKVELELDDKTGKITSVQSGWVPLDVQQVGQDPKIAQLAQNLKEHGMDEVLGQVAEAISKDPTREGEADSPLSNWIAQVGQAYSKAPIFIHNTGATRVSLEPGVFTRRTLLDLFPFDDQIVQFSISGREFKSFIRHNLLPWNKYVYAGLEITYTRKHGKVKKLEVFLNGKPVENKKMYRVATNSFVARQPEFARVQDKQIVGDRRVRQLITEALQQGPLYAPTTGHIREL